MEASTKTTCQAMKPRSWSHRAKTTAEKLPKVMSLGAPENEYVLKWIECVIKSLSRVSMT